MSGESSKYVCEDPPCLHVVVDWQSKKFAVFLEDAEESILYIPASKLLKACENVKELIRKHVAEAKGEEADPLAEKYLGAELIEYEDYE